MTRPVCHEEGRVRKSGASLVYDYYIKDHLGNTRMTLTEATDVTVYMATMETEYKSFEESLFLNLDASRVTSTSGNKTIDGSITANEASRLNGNVSSRRSGPGKLMAVTAGDEVDMEVYAKYDGSFGSSTALAQSTMVTAVAATFGGVSGGSTEQQSIYNLFNGNAGYFYVGGSGNSGEPRAYLNYILFDQDFNYLSGGFDQVTSAASGSHEKLFFNTVNITQGGYLYVFVSNESNTNFEVYFDDLRITHTKGAILQEDHYYPFGANISALSSTAPLSKPNQFKFGGQEEQTDFDIGWYNFETRMYNPTIGRWNSIDPYADIYEDQNPYNYALNSPLNVIDPDGSLVVYVNGFRVGAYWKYLSYNTWDEGFPIAPWIHEERLHKSDVYEYWGEFDINIGQDWEARYYVDGMFNPTSSGGDRFGRGEKESKLLAEKIKSGEITLEDGETIKLVGHSHGAAHAMGMAQGLLDGGIDPNMIDVLLFAPHQPNQIQSVGVNVYQFSRLSDLVSSSGAFNSVLKAIEGANFNIMPFVVDRFGGHDVHTYTTSELKEQNPKLFQYFVDQGILNDDGTLKEDNEK